MADTQALARIDPQALILKAVETGSNIETMERLVALAEHVREVQAKGAYYQAKAEFQRKCPAIKKTRTAKIATMRASYQYTYAPLDVIMDTIRPVMGELGLTVSWSSRVETGRVIVTCQMAHALGYSENSGEVSMPFSEDPGGMGANPSQRVGIALTYARRYSLLSIAGLAPEDEDDEDGVSPTPPKPEDLMPQKRAEQPPAPAPTPPVAHAPEPPKPEPAKPAAPPIFQQASQQAEMLPPGNGSTKPNRPAIFGKVRERARKEGIKETEVLMKLTGKQSMAHLDDAACAKLDEELSK